MVKFIFEPIEHWLRFVQKGKVLAIGRILKKKVYLQIFIGREAEVTIGLRILSFIDAFLKKQSRSASFGYVQSQSF